MQTQQEFQIVPINKIVESATNPRRRFSEQGLLDLTESVRKHGVLVPLLVRPVNGNFEIIAGARRYRAGKAADLQELPVRVKEIGDDEALELQILENLQREDVHPLEEAAGFKVLLDRPGYDIDALCVKVDRSQSYVYQRLQLLHLIPAAQDDFLQNRITAGHAILIARLEMGDQEKALAACFDDYHRENNKPLLIGVRQLAGWIQLNILLDLHKAPFSKTATDLGITTPCVTCPKRTGFAPQLFPDIAKKDTCTHPKCYAMKVQAHVARKKEELKAKGEKVVELTTEYSRPYGTKAKASDPVYKESWREVTKKDSCSSVQTAIVVAGREAMGQVLRVCMDKTCKKHHGGYSYHRDPKEIAREKDDQRKRKSEGVIRGALADRILEKVKRHDDFSINSKYFLAESFIREMQNDDVKLVLKRHGWEPAKTKGEYPDLRQILKDKANNLEVHDLHALLIELALASHIFMSTWATLDRPRELLDLAKEYDVNIKAIEDEIKAAAPETKKLKTATKAPKLQPKTAKGKTKAAKR